MEGISVLL
jgi:hypothetical protein